MIVQCPNCDTKYQLDEARLRPGGSRVRCSRCSHIFSVSLPFPEDEVGVVQDSELEWLKDVNVPAGAKNKAESPAPDAMSGPLYEKKDGKIPLEIPSARQPRTSVMTWVLAAIALVSAVLILSLYFFPGGQEVIRSIFAPAEKEKPAQQPEVLAADPTDMISLQNVRQYFVTNEKIGQLFVIEGKARNDFPGPVELIKIEASLFDGQGQVVMRQEFLAGNTVSLFQLQIFSVEELQAALQAEAGILSHNTNLRLGMDVPFMVVFSNPPDLIQEYGLKVIGAQHLSGR